MKRFSIYLDTSVISHLQANDVPDKMATTLKLWSEIQNGNYKVYISGIVLSEIDECPEPKKTILNEYMERIEYEEILLNEEILSLAQKYIDEGIIPVKYRDDALHISSASVYNSNAIVSWNFKHMVKLKTIIGVNGINKFMGYNEIEILSPDSIIAEEEE